MKTVKKIISVIVCVAFIACMAMTGMTTVSAKETPTVSLSTFAKLDGSEYNIVSPGLGTDASVSTIDRYVNFTKNGTISNAIHIARSNANVYKENPTVDFSTADLLTFELTIEDNGAWEYYKDYIKILLISGSNQLYIPAEDVAEGLSAVTPGKTQKVKFNLNNLDKTKLTAVKQVTFQFKDSTCELNLGIKIKNVKTEVVFKGATFAKLDGSEYNIVSPGLGSDASVKTVDRYVNFTVNGNIRNAIHIARNNASVYSSNPTVDFSAADVLTFELTIEDNGAWEYYKDYIKILLISGSNQLYIPAEDVAEGLSAVTPGKTQKVKFNLNNLDKTKLTAVKQVTFQFKGSTSELNLGIKIKNVKVELLPEYVFFAQLDGYEYPIVQPGYQGVDLSCLDRELNFTGDGTNGIGKYVQVNRTAKSGWSAVDLSLCDYFAVNIWVEDNGAWDVYKDYVSFLFLSNNKQVDVPSEVARKAVSSIVPGAWSRIYIDLNAFDKSTLTSVNLFRFSVAGTDQTSDLNLHIKASDAYGEMIRDDVAIIDDENDEKGAYSDINESAARVRVGSKSLVFEEERPDGWITFKGFYSEPAMKPVDISSVIGDGNLGAVRFWIYVDDIASFDSVKELQSSGVNSYFKLGTAKNPDGSYYRWGGWASQVKRSGWNEIILKFSDAIIESPYPAPDATVIDTLYVKLPTGAASMKLYIDDIKVSSDVNPSAIAGDINGDGELNIIDYIALAKAIDSGSGDYTSNDLVLEKKYLLFGW